MKRLAMVLVLVAAGGTASAQSRKAADRVHDFHTMDRQTPMTTFGVSLGYESWDDNPLIDNVMTIDIGGQFVSESGAGGYLTIPLTYVETADLPIIGSDSEMAIGNVELGGLYAARLGKQADMVFHGGVALPTADDDDAGAFGYLGSFVHLNDLADRAPNVTWLRAGVSPMGRASIFFWRVDAGVDLEIADDDDDGANISPIIRVDVGAGLDFGQGEVSVELDNSFVAPDDDNADDSNSTLAVGGRFKAGNVQPGLALILPVGVDDYDDFNFAIAGSITARMP